MVLSCWPALMHEGSVGSSKPVLPNHAVVGRAKKIFLFFSWTLMLKKNIMFKNNAELFSRKSWKWFQEHLQEAIIERQNDNVCKEVFESDIMELKDFWRRKAIRQYNEAYSTRDYFHEASPSFSITFEWAGIFKSAHNYK